MHKGADANIKAGAFPATVSAGRMKQLACAAVDASRGASCCGVRACGVGGWRRADPSQGGKAQPQGQSRGSHKISIGMDMMQIMDTQDHHGPR
jgi:hypothetical protein